MGGMFYAMQTTQSAAPISYLFIDGGCFNAVLNNIGKDFFRDERPAVDWSSIKKNNRKVFYYDAIPVQNNGEDDNSYFERIKPRTLELANIERQKSYHVRTGDVRNRSKKRGNEQKMVDVQLAVDALLMASRGLFSSFSIITGDLDFRPLVVALVDMGIEVEVMYPVGETNDELLSAADIATPLSLEVTQYWIDNIYALSNDFPTLRYTSDIFVDNDDTRLIKWNTSTIYKSCSLHKLGSRYTIFTDVDDPLKPNRVLLSCIDIGSLRAYARQIYDIEIPEL